MLKSDSPHTVTAALSPRFEWRKRSVAALLHALITTALIASVLVLVVSDWYPAEYRHVSGGWTLLLIVLSVDLCLGPLMTYAVFDIRKPRDVLFRDLVIVGLLQMAALIFGLSVAAESRPVAMVFSVDRFELVAANDLREEELPFAAEDVRQLSWNGPRLYATRTSLPHEVLDAVSLAAHGYDLAQRPTYWTSYADAQSTVITKGRALSHLIAKHGIELREFCRNYPTLSCETDQLLFLPLHAKSGDAAVVVGSSGTVLLAVPLDGF